MGQPSFDFKRFSVRHDACAMKVGTDAVLLGAWVDVSDAERFLDVGTGTGLLALMVAQRTANASIDALEIDTAGAAQALRNVADSPWPDRIRVVQADARSWFEGFYDHIISNPPYFRQALKAPEKKRNQARHDETLRWEDLAALAERLLSPDGRLSLILPMEADGLMEALCWPHHLYLTRRWTVSSLPDRQPHRLLLTFQRQQHPIEHGHLCLQSAQGKRSPEFSALTTDFYR
ncbi:MAG: methyltransferase [Bacteroidales bacterium]|jgi:tRNA1Val (adenine37-N6)-methyltransferase|nr:methyltransferase [Bacteroidales bacterium]OPZ98290.1 MAG: tRNA1(Val) (adenine(37)-N6)-methyltransferase [Bacteroidetes bacterium ADurb.Bin416]